MDEQNTTPEVEKVIEEMSPLKLELDDSTFIEVIDDLRDKSKKFFSKIGLTERRQKNEDYFLGRQIEILEKNKELKKYNARYIDNLIFESEGTLKAVAVSRVPDLIVKAGNDSEESRQIAEDVSEIINNRFRKRENRITLGTAYTHRPIYFTGVIKARWDDELGRYGDYVFDAIHPNNIEVDHTCTSSNADDMNWIIHNYDLSIKEILMRWPKKESELLAELGIEPDSKMTEKYMATKLTISEIWFTWYKKQGDKWVKVEGLAWKYKKVVFDKIKNPYWDWEGETRLYAYDIETKGKKPITEDDIRQSLLTNTPLQISQEKIYHNHFDNPRKPFKFLSHEGLKTMPYDETSRIEQVIYLQDNVNVRGKQITEMASTARGKNVYSTESGLTAEDVSEIDMADPESDILLSGDISKVFAHIAGVQPDQALFQEQDQNRQKVFTKMGTNAALRGLKGGEDTATQTQLFKESDYTRIDNEVEDTINAAAEWMADYAMQFMKLFYTQEHLEKLIGKNGKTVFKKITRDLIGDGMEVEVSASSVDKLRRKREAFELLEAQMIDPVQFFRDIEASDPEGRAKAVFLFVNQPALYYQNYIEGRDTQQMVTDLGQISQQQLDQQPVPTEQAPIV